MIIKKLVFSFYQLWNFIILLLLGRARFHPLILEGDWPDSSNRRSYLSIGRVRLRSDEISVVFGDGVFPAYDCPQLHFFRELESGTCTELTAYYQAVSDLNYEVDLSEWFRNKLSLWKNFDSNLWGSVPIVVKSFNGGYIVEDGAHRLALRILRGHKRHETGISLWYFGTNPNQSRGRAL